MEIFKDILKPFLERLIKEIDAHNYWTVSFYIIGSVLVCIAVGYIISWFLQIRKLKSENDNLKLDSKGKQLALLETVQLKRKLYVDNSILIQLSVKLCLDAVINRDVAGLRTNRDELIDIYFNQLVPSFTDYTEVCEIFYKEERGKILNCIKDEIFPFMETTIICINTINHQQILSALGAEKFLLQRFSINPILTYTKNNIRIYRFPTRRKYKKLLKQIDFDGAT
jgi:hypothetical protein